MGAFLGCFLANKAAVVGYATLAVFLVIKVAFEIAMTAKHLQAGAALDWHVVALGCDCLLTRKEMDRGVRAMVLYYKRECSHWRSDSS